MNEQICRILRCGEQLSLSCRRLSASGQWVLDGRQLQLAVQGVLGSGGNAEVYQVQLVGHSPAAGMAAAAAAAVVRQQQAGTDADDTAAAAEAADAEWWAALDACKAAAADAAVLSSSCSYMPSQQFALKVPKPYQSLSPALQQQISPAAHLQNAAEVL
jgi:hypothetical protein